MSQTRRRPSIFSKYRRRYRRAVEPNQGNSRKYANLISQSINRVNQAWSLVLLYNWRSSNYAGRVELAQDAGIGDWIKGFTKKAADTAAALMVKAQSSIKAAADWFTNATVRDTTTAQKDALKTAGMSEAFIAEINRTPAVKLLGISPSGFNATGESDIRNYYDHVMSKQELLRDGIQKILDIIQLTTTGTIDQSISFEFNALGADDDQADVQTAAARVNMLNSLLQTNVLSAEEVRKSVKEDKKTKLGFIPDDLPQPNAGA